MPLIFASPTLTTTAAALWTEVAGAGSKSRQVTVQNRGATTVILGSSALTGTPPTTYGYLVPANGAITLTIDANDMLYGAASSSTQQVNVLVCDVS